MVQGVAVPYAVPVISVAGYPPTFVSNVLSHFVMAHHSPYRMCSPPLPLLAETGSLGPNEGLVQ
jgi:hypothetical protein